MRTRLRCWAVGIGGGVLLALLNEITITLLQENTVTLLGGVNTLDKVDTTAGPEGGG